MIESPEDTRETSGRAVAALVLGILSILTAQLFLIALAGLMVGSFAVSETKMNPAKGGYGLAIAGLTLCLASFALGVLEWLTNIGFGAGVTITYG
jgi:hypothetical protein